MSDTGVPGGVWFYIPTLAAAILFAPLFALIGCIVIYHAFRGGLRRFFWVVLVGIVMEVGGFACRAVASYNLSEVAPFAIQQSLIVLAPLFIAAGNYMVISRLICASNDGAASHQRILSLPARRITPIFVTCDIVTIMIQVSGTSISAGGNWKGKTATTGSNILLAGLAIQSATIAFFVSIALKFGGRRLFTFRTAFGEDYLKGLKAIFVSSVFIELRCIFRLIEHATGYNGYLFTHEWDFYVFEAFPMIIAIGIYALWYPPHYIPKAMSEKLSPEEAEGAGHRRRPSLEDGVAS